MATGSRGGSVVARWFAALLLLSVVCSLLGTLVSVRVTDGGGRGTSEGGEEGARAPPRILPPEASPPEKEERADGPRFGPGPTKHATTSNHTTTTTTMGGTNVHNRSNSDGSSRPGSVASSVPRSNGTASPAFAVGKTFAACLLVKDDNDILNEWIAYHYHVLNLRHLIVATDPSSETSPSALLDRWRGEPFGMDILEWKDEDYMPAYFLEGDFARAPSFLPKNVMENTTASVWHQNPDDPANLTQEKIEEDLVLINNHRFRQATFVSYCFERFKEDGRSWVAHIDTDEYMVVNPRLRIRPRAVKGVDLPAVPHAGSILEFLSGMFLHYPKRLFPSCVMMPTILFGATENHNQTLLDMVPSSSWNRDRFESLRWTYHAEWKDIANGMQKAIVDVSTLSVDHPVFANHLIKSVHQPLDSKGTKQICRRMTLKPDVDAVRLYPLTINHYVGSLERYTSRKDARRNLHAYREKAASRAWVDDGWIQGWLASFVSFHGEDACRRVLGDYYHHESAGGTTATTKTTTD